MGLAHGRFARNRARSGIATALCLGVLASAARSEGVCPADLEPQQLLQAVNAVRAQARVCGARSWPAVPALQWDERLASSAQLFAQELAQRDSLSHEGKAARSLRERLRASAYSARMAGENLAAGLETLQDTVDQWLSSPGHCENLMQADFADMGLACASGPGRYQTYWVLHMARASAR